MKTATLFASLLLLLVAATTTTTTARSINTNTDKHTDTIVAARSRDPTTPSFHSKRLRDHARATFWHNCTTTMSGGGNIGAAVQALVNQWKTHSYENFTGGALCLSSGTYAFEVVVTVPVNLSVIIMGEDAATTILDAAPAGALFHANNALTLVFTNITIVGGGSNGAVTGSIYTFGAIGSIIKQNQHFTTTLTTSDYILEDTLVIHNGMPQGGAIRGVSTYFVFENVSFVENIANSTIGGALYLTCDTASTTGCYATVSGCTFDHNYGAGGAGAIYAQGVLLDVMYSAFTNNFVGTAISVYGGAITFNAASKMLYVTNTVFSHNSGSCGGTAIALCSNSATIMNSEFLENSSGQYTCGGVHALPATILYNNNLPNMYNLTYAENTFQGQPAPNTAQNPAACPSF